VIYAFFYGVFYGAILLRTNKIIPIAIIHGLNNFVFQFDLLSTETTEAVIESQGLVSQLTGAMFTTLLTLPLFLVGLYHLRIIEREKQKTNLI
jgi:membrane protease YdiL (CAAX protease family)